MNNIQFYVLLGTVLAGVIWQRADYQQLSARLDALSARVDKMNAALNGRIDRMGTELNARIDRISADLNRFYHDLGRHEEALERLKNK